MKEIRFDPIVEQTKEKLRTMGVEGLLLDLDDTLIYTGEIFTGCMAEYVDVVCAETGIDRVSFGEDLRNYNDSEYRRFGVSPDRWNVVIELLAQKYEPAGESIRDRLSILKKIYTTVPRLRPGARETLEIVSCLNIRLALVTHASVEWTNWKMEATGLLNYFDAIVIADVMDSKKADHWKKAAELIGIDPVRCLAVGDNLKGDVINAASLGMKTALLNSPWGVYREGVVPEGTIRLNELFDLLTS